MLETAIAISRSRNVYATFSAQNHAVRTLSTCSTNFVDPGYAFKVNAFSRTIDVALHELNTRFEGHQSIMKLFSFLYPHRLATSSYEDIITSATNIIKEFKFDFLDDLEFEIRSFATEFKSEIQEKQTVMDVLKVLQDSRVSSSFPQFHKLLILFLTIPVTVAAAKRSFSQLTLIKTFVNVTIPFV